MAESKQQIEWQTQYDHLPSLNSFDRLLSRPRSLFGCLFGGARLIIRLAWPFTWWDPYGRPIGRLSRGAYLIVHLIVC